MIKTWNSDSLLTLKRVDLSSGHAYGIDCYEADNDSRLHQRETRWISFPLHGYSAVGAVKEGLGGTGGLTSKGAFPPFRRRLDAWSRDTGMETKT